MTLNRQTLPPESTAPGFETSEAASDKAKESTLLSPRFYTTDFKAMDAIDVTPVRAEWDAMMAEYEGDNNHDHFQRDAAFGEEAVRPWLPCRPSCARSSWTF